MTRELPRQIGSVVADLPRFVTAPLYRSWHLRWGATNAELAATMPGDDLLPRAQFRPTRAITSTAWKVDSFLRNEWLLWRKPDSTWSWVLRDLGDGRTRLITRVHVLYDWSRPAYGAFGVVLMEFGDFAMMRRMLLGIKVRAESTSPAAMS